MAWAAQARRVGVRVEVDPLGLDPEALWQAAQAPRHPACRLGPDGAAGSTGPRCRQGRAAMAGDDWEEVDAMANR